MLGCLLGDGCSYLEVGDLLEHVYGVSHAFLCLIGDELEGFLFVWDVFFLGYVLELFYDGLGWYGMEVVGLGA